MSDVSVLQYRHGLLYSSTVMRLTSGSVLLYSLLRYVVYEISGHVLTRGN